MPHALQLTPAVYPNQAGRAPGSGRIDLAPRSHRVCLGHLPAEASCGGVGMCGFCKPTLSAEPVCDAGCHGAGLDSTSRWSTLSG